MDIIWYPTQQYSAQIEYLNISFGITTSQTKLDQAHYCQYREHFVVMFLGWKWKCLLGFHLITFPRIYNQMTWYQVYCWWRLSLTLLSNQTDEKLLFARILKWKWKSHLSLVVFNRQNKKAKQAKHVFFLKYSITWLKNIVERLLKTMLMAEML